MMMSTSKGWLTVIGGFCIHLVLGTLYLWANITSAVTSRLRVRDPSLTYDDTLLVYAASLAGQGSTMILGGLIAQKVGCKLCCAFGSVILISGTLLAARAETLPVIIIAQGLMLGFGMGLCYTAPISAAMRYLPHRKGAVTGIIVGGFGCGAFFFGMLATHIVNPHGESVQKDGPYENYFPPDSKVIANVPKMFQFLAAAYLVCTGIGVLLISEPAENYSPDSLPLPAKGEDGAGDDQTVESRKKQWRMFGRQGYQSTSTTDDDVLPGEQRIVSRHSIPEELEIEMRDLSCSVKQNADASDEVETRTTEVDIRPEQIIFLPIAWHLSSCLITTTVGGVFLAGTFKTFGQHALPNHETFLSTMSALASIFNSLGRIAWGLIGDRFGPLYTLQIMALLFSCIIATYSFSTQFAEAGFALWSFLIFFFEGANFVLYVPITVLLFGSRSSASNYGVIFTLYNVVTSLNTLVLARIGVGFLSASLLMGGLTFLGFCNLLLLRLHINKLQQSGALSQKQEVR